MYLADLHLHSKFSMATSRDCDCPHLDLWARRKGIGLLGTGDFTHPAWREELGERLIPDGEGLYSLKPEYRLPESRELPQRGNPRFVVTGELSTIYKKGGKTRRVHSLILLPGLEAAGKLALELERRGCRLQSDGRPVLGMDTRDLLELTLDVCPEAVFIPAHIWTPHFSVFGAFSAFSSLEECFGDMASQISALETGLSSDPPMNWRVSQLDRCLLVSNSDAHSPQKLGREANLLEGEPGWSGLKKALSTGEGFHGTVEFFPEEGKYHLDGHRACGVALTPEESARCGGLCPVCGKKLTIGVAHRIGELSDRPAGVPKPGAKPFWNLLSLPGLLSACTGVSEKSKKVQALYRKLTEEMGPEFPLLLETPVSDLRQIAGPAVAEGLRRLRSGEVRRIPGYDGKYGAVQVFTPEELRAFRE